MAVAAVVFAVVATASASSAAPDPVIRGKGSATAIAGQYIVVLKDTASVRKAGIATRARSLAGAHQGVLGYVYQRALHGFAAGMSESEALKLAADPDVAYVEQDQMLQLADTQENPPAWGLDRIVQRARPLDATYSYDSTASNVHAYVIDTGIRITHQEFGGRASYGWNFHDNTPIANDCYTDAAGNPLGHGTHVAGIIGSTTYGVAKGVHLVTVKVFGCSGGAAASTIIAGINWVTDNAIRPAVANLSVRVPCTPGPCDQKDIDAIDAAITGSINSGITYAVSAGNDNVDACTGLYARVPLAITVGATDINDARASYSDWGRCVNVWAPGGDQPRRDPGIVSVGSASDTATATMSGTSMAAPHVAGAVALILARPGWDTATPSMISDELLNKLATNGVMTDPVAGHNSTTRLLYTGPPPIAGGSSIAVAHHADGRLSLFGVNQAGQLMYRSQVFAGSLSWAAWTVSQDPDWYCVAAETDGGAHTDPGGHPEAGGHIELIGLSRTVQDIWYRTQAASNTDTWSNWSGFDGALTSDAVALGSTGRLEVFGTNAQGQAWHRSQTSPGVNNYTAWQPFGFNAVLRSVAAEQNANGQIEVFALTNTGQLWHRWQTTPTSADWTPWVQLDGLLTSVAVARNSDGLLELFGTNSQGQAFHRSAVLGTNAWLGWTQFDAAAPVGPLSSVAADTNTDGRVELFTVSRTGQIWHRSQDSAGSLTYSDWSQLDGTLRP